MTLGLFLLLLTQGVNHYGEREQQPEIGSEFAGSVLLRWIAMAVCVIVMICCGVYLVRLAVESHTIKEETQGAAEQYVQPIPSADTTDPAAESSSEEGNASPVTVDFASLQIGLSRCGGVGSRCPALTPSTIR